MRRLDELARLLARAREYLDASESSFKAARYNVAYEEARTAAELYTKALILRRSGSYPRDHNVAGPAANLKVLPEAVPAKRLSDLLQDYTRGTYGLRNPPNRVEVKDALALARALGDACGGA